MFEEFVRNAAAALIILDTGERVEACVSPGCSVVSYGQRVLVFDGETIDDVRVFREVYPYRVVSRSPEKVPVLSVATIPPLMTREV